MSEHVFSAGFLFAGIGAGALGFIRAMGRLGSDRARFRNLGGVDNDPDACKDFEYLTGGRATCADVATMTPADLRAAMGDEVPDCIFLSPPCKGFSGLLSNKAAGELKYQKLNQLVYQGLFLVCETWERPPSLLVLENVPRIQSRGKGLLAKARQLLARYGYVFHESTHDCGEIGGLAQHRRRYLLVARLPSAVPGFVYRPPKQRVRGCGEVLGELPLPEDPAAGELHKLPKLSWLNWVRLALIPAGGDWRDLPERLPSTDNPNRHHNKYQVNGWAEPAGTVIGATRPGSGAPSVADPRLSELVALKTESRPNLFGVLGWEQPAKSVTGSASVSGSNGVAAVADPRVPELSSPVAPGQERRAVWARYDVRAWSEPARTVAGPGVNGGFGVADPRPAREYRNGTLGVLGWSEPAKTVTGENWPLNGTNSVADPRLGCEPRAGVYGVVGWEDAAATITGNARIDNGRFAVADPRKPPPVVPVIIAADGTWHRPLTTLELAVLQALPAVVNGKPLKLAGKTVSAWRERIGNAVPVGAGQAIADCLLTALLAAALGTWTLGGTGIWVRQDGITEDELAQEAA